MFWLAHIPNVRHVQHRLYLATESLSHSAAPPTRKMDMTYLKLILISVRIKRARLIKN